MIIDVILGGQTYWDKGVPCVSGGRLEKMDTSRLEKKVHTIDNENEKTIATEYWLDGQLVHRSVEMELKKGIFATGEQSSFI